MTIYKDDQTDGEKYFGGIQTIFNEFFGDVIAQPENASSDTAEARSDQTLLEVQIKYDRIYTICQYIAAQRLSGLALFQDGDIKDSKLTHESSADPYFTLKYDKVGISVNIRGADLLAHFQNHLSLQLNGRHFKAIQISNDPSREILTVYLYHEVEEEEAKEEDQGSGN